MSLATASSSILEEDTFEENQDKEANNLIDKTLLCLLNKSGHLGVAYYNFFEKTLNVYEEMSDPGPHYLISSTIFRELNPTYVLTFGNTTEEYVKAIIDIFTSDTNNTSTSTSMTAIPAKFYLVSLKEFTYEACKSIVTDMKIASKSADQQIQEIFGNSLIDFNNKLSVQALGALYKYLERHWSLFGVDPQECHFMEVNQVTLRNHVLFESKDFCSLNIVSHVHNNAFTTDESFSVYQLFMSACKSRMGQAQLRRFLLSPINDRKELEKRLTFLDFVLHPDHMDFITNLQDTLKRFRTLGHVSTALDKIQSHKATNKVWDNLHKMIYYTIFIKDISHGYRDSTEIFTELHAAVTDNLVRLLETITNAIDFSEGGKQGRPVIKFGLDPSLDSKLLFQEDIFKHVTAAAEHAIYDLPDYIDECKIQYLPEIGFFMTIKQWAPGCNPEQLEYLDYQYQFSFKGMFHYKTPLCVALDRKLGNNYEDIIEHENRILERLSKFVIKYNKEIRNALRMVAIIDSLVAMAKTAQQNNYVKPTLNDSNIHELTDCRHPLLDRLLNTFEPNSFYSGGPHSHVKIITGANGSGKSVFLKQVVLTIYLAHIGCYVPARLANIAMVDSIHCVLHTNESAVMRLSSFMTDLTKTAQVFRYAGPSSLIIVDEFGQGTADDDGLVLLAAFVKYYLDKGDECPHLLVSTHLQKIAVRLPEDRYLEYFKMEHEIQDGLLCSLYRLSKGMSHSYAFHLVSAYLGEEQAQVAQKYFDFLQGVSGVNLPEETEKLREAYLELEVLPSER